jgi:hypothetical protein
VVDGALRAEGREFGPWAWGYVAPGDAAEPAAAEHGARVLCLDYPLAA